VVAALWALAASWPSHDEVKDVLEQASRSKDPAIRSAVRSSDGEGPGQGKEGR
jgi:hypothetical protein